MYDDVGMVPKCLMCARLTAKADLFVDNTWKPEE